MSICDHITLPQPFEKIKKLLRKKRTKGDDHDPLHYFVTCTTCGESIHMENFFNHARDHLANW